MPPPVRDSQLLKGVLPMLVLAALTEQESYGYQLVNRLHDAGLTDVAYGTEATFELLVPPAHLDAFDAALAAATAGTRHAVRGATEILTR